MEQVIAATQGGQCARVHQRNCRTDTTRKSASGACVFRGGQKQRISIARAFLANPTILLLDEPTSSVEPDSEAAIIAALDRLMQNRTTVLTSHRPSLINQADWVYVIEDGRVTEQGRPENCGGTGAGLRDSCRCAATLRRRRKVLGMTLRSRREGGTLRANWGLFIEDRYGDGDGFSDGRQGDREQGGRGGLYAAGDEL